MVIKTNASRSTKKKTKRTNRLNEETKKYTKSTLKLICCGSVDDGKSTLLGRLFFESGNITKDKIATL